MMMTELKKLYVGSLRLTAGCRKLGIGLMRVAIFVIFVWIGGLKFWNYEAEGIVPFRRQQPFHELLLYEIRARIQGLQAPRGRIRPAKRDWHTANNTYGFSRGLGVLIMGIGVLAFLGMFFPKAGLVGAILAILMTVGTLSFLATTPEAWVPDLGAEHGFPLLSGAGRLVVKDIAILAGAVILLSESARRLLNEQKNNGDEDL